MASSVAPERKLYHSSFSDRGLPSLSLEAVQTPYYEHFPSSSLLVARDPEAIKTPKPTDLARWPSISGLILHTLVLLFSFSIIGLIFHSKMLYSGSRDIHFSGINISWPKDIDLFPVEFVLVLTAVSVVHSFLSITQHCRRFNSTPIGVIDMSLAGFSLLLFGAWIAGIVLLARTENSPSSTLRQWACRRKDSPSNILVDYASVCREQVRKKITPLTARVLTYCRNLSWPWQY